MSGELVWLASYPKSGNTWLRAVLAHLVGGADGPPAINRMGLSLRQYHAADRWRFDAALGMDSADLDPDEVQELRPAFYVDLAGGVTDTMFVKIHDRCDLTPAGQPLVPASVTRAVLYLIRNPLDVAVSFAHHEGVKIDCIIDRMCSPDDVLYPAAERLVPQLPQRMGDWTGHVRSWTRNATLPVHVVRYEDLLADPVTHFGGALRFAGLDPEPQCLARAVEYCAFARLQAQERVEGFIEKTPRAPCFFRSGQGGAWVSALRPDQVARILEMHGAEMRHWGYLDHSGQPI